MVGLGAPTVIAIVIAIALGGSARNLLQTSIRWWPVVLIAFGIELVLYNPPVNEQAWAHSAGPAIWIVTKLALLAALLRNGCAASNRRAWPWLVASLGLGLNTLVIALNAGHMPRSDEAAVAVWGTSRLDATRLQNVAPMGPDTRLPWLGDVLPQPGWLPRPNVISAGDILLATGIAWWAFGATRPSRRRRTRIVDVFRAPPPPYAPARSQWRRSRGLESSSASVPDGQHTVVRS